MPPHLEVIATIVDEPLRKSLTSVRRCIERKNSDWNTDITTGEHERQLKIPDRPDVDSALWRDEADLNQLLPQERYKVLEVLSTDPCGMDDSATCTPQLTVLWWTARSRCMRNLIALDRVLDQPSRRKYREC
jgi:hypothetical protein